MYALYYNIFLWSVIFFTLIIVINVSNRGFDYIHRGLAGTSFAFFICIVCGVWLGHRPPTYEFADTGNYAWSFELMKYNQTEVSPNALDWVWDQFTYVCSQIMNVQLYFTLIALGYFLCTFYSCYLLTRKNVLITFLFMMGSFSFFSYGVNGIRNGLACAMVLVIIALFLKSQKNLLLCTIIAFFAINIHKSVILPLGALFASVYFIKTFKKAYQIWLFSIIVSLIAGSSVSAFFAGLGFDDRLSYLTARNDIYTKVGFRWDFLIYSMMPIILGYYVVVKRKIQDKTYEILLNTYTLANAFWVMVIRANYSNRFAYLSWFMYPLLLAYPLLKLDIWGNSQGRKLCQIMIAQVAFTLIMSKFM